MKGDSTGGKRQVVDSLRQTNSARERGPSLDTLDSLVRCPRCGATVTSEISPGYHNCGFCYTYFTANAELSFKKGAKRNEL